MKGGALRGWINKHPVLYAEALKNGIDQRTLENTYSTITKNMSNDEKISYDKNNLKSGADTPLFQERIREMHLLLLALLLLLPLAAAGWLTGWLANRLAGWLAGWLAACWLAWWLAACLAGWLPAWLAAWLACFWLAGLLA